MAISLFTSNVNNYQKPNQSSVETAGSIASAGNSASIFTSAPASSSSSSSACYA